MDPLSSAMMMFGCVLLAASWFLLLQISFDNDFSWGLTTLFLPPLSYLYACFAWEKARDAVWFAVAGVVLVGLGLS